MKLNLGCGGDYKKGYLNVDAYDSTVADELMSSIDLKLADNTVDEVLCSQLIEHLGIAGSIYSLSEIFRVLKSGKKLIIETPDLKTSFEKYLKGEREDRKNLLPWIYGVDIPGMIHRFCYPDDLLEETLKTIGFKNIKKEFIETDKYQPTLSVSCEKPSDYEGYQIITIFRKKLVKEKIVDLDNQLIALEQEKLIEFFINNINKFVKTGKQNYIEEIVIEGGVYSPIMTIMLLNELIQEDILKKKLVKNYIEVLEKLSELDFPNDLLQILMETQNFVGQQEKLFVTVCNLGKITVEKILDSEKKQEIINNLEKISNRMKSSEKIVFLSKKQIMLKSNHFFQIGYKKFILRDYESAINLFKESAKLYRNQIFIYWNLGRLLYLKGEKNESIHQYENALKVLELLDYQNKKMIRTKIQEEMKKHPKDKINIPIDSF